MDGKPVHKVITLSNGKRITILKLPQSPAAPPEVPEQVPPNPSTVIKMKENLLTSDGSRDDGTEVLHPLFTDSHSLYQDASWDRNTTLCLIEMYKKFRNKVGTHGLKNLKRLWFIIAEEVNKNFQTTFTPNQVENRWRVLERNYKKVVDNNNKTGRGRKSFEFEKEMDEIFQKKKNIHPELLLDSQIIHEMPRQVEEVETGNNETTGDDLDSSQSVPVLEVNTSRAVHPTPATLATEAATKHRANKNRPNKTNVLDLIRQDKKQFYEQYLKAMNEKLAIERDKLALREARQLEKSRKNELLEERNKILKMYLENKIKIPD